MQNALVSHTLKYVLQHLKSLILKYSGENLALANVHPSVNTSVQTLIKQDGIKSTARLQYFPLSCTVNVLYLSESTSRNCIWFASFPCFKITNSVFIFIAVGWIPPFHLSIPQQSSVCSLKSLLRSESDSLLGV